jgi:predicted nucleic acid-binding protein
VKRLVVLDNTILTNFALVNRAHLIYQLWSGSVCTTPQVLQEFHSAVEHGLLPGDCWKDLPVVELNKTEIRMADKIGGKLNKGE